MIAKTNTRKLSFMVAGIAAALVFSIYAVLMSSARTSDARILPQQPLESFDERKAFIDSTGISDPILNTQTRTSEAAEHARERMVRTVMGYEGIMPPDTLLGVQGYGQVPNFYGQVPNFYGQVPNFGGFAPMGLGIMPPDIYSSGTQLGIQSSHQHYPWWGQTIYNPMPQQQIGTQAVTQPSDFANRKAMYKNILTRASNLVFENYSTPITTQGLGQVTRQPSITFDDSVKSYQAKSIFDKFIDWLADALTSEYQHCIATGNPDC